MTISFFFFLQSLAIPAFPHFLAFFPHSFFCHSFCHITFGRKADKKRKLFNGRIKTDYYQFEGPRPPRI